MCYNAEAPTTITREYIVALMTSLLGLFWDMNDRISA